MTNTTPEPRSPEVQTKSPNWIPTLLHRWPTVLGILAAGFNLAGEKPEAAVLSLAMILFIASLCYLITAVLDRPKAVWLVVLGVVVVVAATKIVDVDYWLALGPVAVVAILVGLLRGTLRRPGLYALQVPAMLVFGAAALAAERLDPNWAALLVAAALLGHVAWDLAHFVTNKVVARSLSEWCAALDFVLALGMLWLAFG